MGEGGPGGYKLKAENGYAPELLTVITRDGRENTGVSLGNSEELMGGMLVDRYILFQEEAELTLFDECAAAVVDTETYYPCFAIGRTK